MRLSWIVVFVVLSIIEFAQHVKPEAAKDYLNHWVVEIEGGKRHVENVVAPYGFKLDREFRSLKDHYLLTRADVPHRSKRSAEHHSKRIAEDSRIKFVEQQREVLRVKRDYEESRKLYNRDLAGKIARSTGESSSDLNDPELGKQWYIEKRSNAHAKMNIRGAWRRGMSGKNICVTILDDGVESDHPDLAINYNPNASYDFNDNDPNPYPRYDPTNENKHGTRCAGEIAMVANNNVCGVGIAFDACIGGLRILDGKVTDHLEGDALGFSSENIDISSASWGPNDDGMTLEGPGKLAWKGILQSINKGRHGKGTIMVWAAGNGAMKGDNCNCDGYTSSIYTLSVASASEGDKSPWYSERCASTHATTYSSGSMHERKVISADLHGKCTHEHSGTSAAAPMAAGVIALVLEKNPELTWRDAQHLVAFTSNYDELKHEAGWYRNAAGFCVSHAFGFGLLDAGAMVDVADPNVWKHVGEQRICRVTPDNSTFPIKLTSGNSIEVKITTEGCKGQDQEVDYLEHIQVVLTLDYSKRGKIFIELESPSGTITPLMFERQRDHSDKGFQQWPLTSVHTWGEDPKGIWKLRVADRKTDGAEGMLRDVELMLYGTQEKPFYYDFIDKNKCPELNQYPENSIKKPGE